MSGPLCLRGMCDVGSLLYLETHLKTEWGACEDEAPAASTLGSGADECWAGVTAGVTDERRGRLAQLQPPEVTSLGKWSIPLCSRNGVLDGPQATWRSPRGGDRLPCAGM